MGTLTLRDNVAQNITLFLSEDSDSGLDITDTSTVTINPAAAAKFVIGTLIDSPAGTATTVPIEVHDAFGNIVTDYDGIVTLVCSGGTTGCGIVTITDGVGSININNVSIGSVNLSLSDSSGSGLDATSSDSVFFTTLPDRIVILNPTDSTAGTATTVNIEVQDTNGDVVTSSYDDVTLVCSGSASGCGLVNIAAGIGSMTVNDLVAETVNLSLTDSEATGLDVTSTQNVVFSAGAATKFVIINPSDTTAGTPTTVDIEVQDANGNLVTTYNNDVTLVCSGLATGCGLVAITAGEGSMSVNDLVAQTVNLSLTDSQTTGLNVSSTQNVIFAVGAAAKFVILYPANSIAGTATTVTIQVQDANNNLVSTYQNDVTLVADGSATGEGLVAITNGTGSLSINDLVAETVNLSLSDSQSTSLNVASTQNVVFAPGVATKFVILDPVDSTAGTATDVDIEVQDANGNLVTSYNNDVTLVCSGSASGCGLVAITAGEGTKSVNDLVAQTVNLSLTDSQLTGLNVSSTQSVVFAVGAAAKFVILNPADSNTGTATTVEIKVRDANNNLVTSYNTDVTLLCTGTATGCGLVAITSGEGSMSVNDAEPETVTLTLDDTLTTGLDVTSTQNVVFTDVAPPNPTGLGAVVNSSTQITLSWTSGGGTTHDYIIAYEVGNTAPDDCTDGTVIPASQVTGTSKAVTGLAQNTEYTFLVCAINANSTPDLSSGVATTATTLNTDGIAPNPSRLMLVENNTTEMLPSWLASSGGAATAGYLLVRRVGSPVTWTPSAGATYTLNQDLGAGHKAIYIGTSLNTPDTIPTAGATYHYAVFVFDSEKDYSAAQTAWKKDQRFLTDGLVGYWQMNEASWNGTNDEVVDASGTGNHGTAYNGANTTTGKYSAGGVFNGNNDFYAVPSSPSL